ncbi:MAG: proteasome assembly chaperone family protein [Candidatus Thermoplasmatota archaeon]|jgi:hypothetical protein|nr:proteasome assembly chaperone family protein [Candidatus Thermoplasmatota archaeon]MDP7265841.1 proteasome assembly chaperone family protein [Candidatus Thermoplasmatota archaeon]
MDNVIIDFIDKPELKNPVLIEGLPGIGDVGKIAAKLLIDQLSAKKIISIYSRFLPPQVLVTDEGIIKPMQNEIYYVKTEKDHELMILTGDYQGLTSEGQYDLSYGILKLLKDLNVVKIITLGGYGVRKIPEEPRVLGAATGEKLLSEMKKYGVHFETGHPSSGIVGASGLLLGLARLFNLEGVCLMGETHGFFPDPQGAKTVLKVLSELFDLKLDYTSLEKISPDLEILKARLKELEEVGNEGVPDSAGDLSYFA